MKSKIEEKLKKERYFWTTEYVKEHAINYRPWYKGIRSLPYFWSTLELLGFFVWCLCIGDPFGAIGNLNRILLIVLPLWIFAAKGYRWALYVGCGLQIFWLIVGLLNGARSNYMLSIFLVVMFISAIRIENYRVKYNLSKKHTFFKDCLIACCPILLFLVVCTPSYHMLSEAAKQAGFWYKGIHGYERYCAKQGYHMKLYPETFEAKFSEQIRKTDKTLRLFGTSLDKAWKSYENDTTMDVLEKAVARDIDKFSKDVALMSQLKSGSSSSNQSQTDLNNVKSLQDICRIIDENATTLLNR